MEEEWWRKKLDECKEAERKGDMGEMYDILQTLGLRDYKGVGGAERRAEEYKEHFERVRSQRMENIRRNNGNRSGEK